MAKNERIMGRMSLIKQNRVMFLAWLPYSPGSLLPDGTFHSPPIVAAAPTARGELHRTACSQLASGHRQTCTVARLMTFSNSADQLTSGTCAQIAQCTQSTRYHCQR